MTTCTSGSTAHSRSMVSSPSQPGGMRMSTNAIANGRPFAAAAGGHLDALLRPAVRIRPRTGAARAAPRALAEQQRSASDMAARRLVRIAAQDFVEILVDGRIVVDHQDAAVGELSVQSVIEQGLLFSTRCSDL